MTNDLLTQQNVTESLHRRHANLDRHLDLQPEAMLGKKSCLLVKSKEKFNWNKATLERIWNLNRDILEMTSVSHANSLETSFIRNNR